MPNSSFRASPVTLICGLSANRVLLLCCHFQKLSAWISEGGVMGQCRGPFPIGTELPCRSDVSVEGLAGHAKFCAQLANVSAGLTIEACARRT